MKQFVLGIVFFYLASTVSWAHSQKSATVKTEVSLFNLLDGNRDGNLNPYEALDVLMQIQEEFNGEELTVQRLETILNEQADDERDEIVEMLKELDSNGDGKTTLWEMDKETREFAQMLDKNKDGTISFDEASAFEMDDDFFMSSADIQQEVEDVFGEFDKNKDGRLTKNEATDEEFSWNQMSEGDLDGNSKVTKEEMTAFLSADNQKAGFKIEGNVAVMSGVINSETPATVLRLIHEHPTVRTIEMANVPGSIDDEANMRAALYIRKFGFTTVIKSNGSVASGGTDFFLAGRKRVVEKGGKLGIHSWGGPVNGDQVPKDDPQHQLYLKYYEKIDIPASFYWRTLEAAPANDIHWMTEKEIEQFNVRCDGSPPGFPPNSTFPDGKEMDSKKRSGVSIKKQLQGLRNELTAEIKELSAKHKLAEDDEARQNVIDQRRKLELKYVERAIPLYRQNEKGERTNIGSMLNLASRTKGQARANIFDTALELHGESEQVESLIYRFGQDVPAPEVHDFLKRLADKSPHEKIKAWSIYYQAELAMELREIAEASRSKLAASYGESFKLYEQHWLGDEGEARITKLLEICEAEYSEVGEKGNTIGDSIKRLRTELRLCVGKVAPDIVGEDLDGKPFKLSEYRGKVVVLDFWGDW